VSFLGAAALLALAAAFLVGLDARAKRRC
jgi:hypothetical protein